MLYRNIIKTERSMSHGPMAHVGLKQWALFSFYLYFWGGYFLFSEYFRLSIVIRLLAAENEKITKQKRLMKKIKIRLVKSETAWDYLPNDGDPSNYKKHGFVAISEQTDLHLQLQNPNISTMFSLLLMLFTTIIAPLIPTLSSQPSPLIPTLSSLNIN